MKYRFVVNFAFIIVNLKRYVKLENLFFCPLNLAAVSSRSNPKYTYNLYKGIKIKLKKLRCFVVAYPFLKNFS